MEALPVTLIVKAPNQQFEDQTIKCEPTWSIRKLKGYLSEVYPCNPTVQEQKLIYSGQLLNDAHILKDVLRQYEGQDTHTVHLVYTPKNRSFSPKAPRKEKTDSNKESKNTSTQSQNQYLQQGTNLGSDGLRHRNNGMEARPSSAQTPFAGFLNSSQSVMPPMSFAQTNANQNYPQYSPEQYAIAQQMAAQNMMHQMYLQYMHQYAASMQQSNQVSSAANYFPRAGMTHFGVNSSNAIVNERPPQQEAAPNPQPVRFQAAIDDDAENRDWLEILYTMSRLLVLLSLVYFYSSPGRCMIVILAFALYYFYQNHQRNLRDRLPERLHEDAGEPDVIEVDNAELANVQNANPVNDNEQRIQNDPSPSVNVDNETAASFSPSGEQDENSRLPTIALLRTFILSFFSSLIPETPAV